VRQNIRGSPNGLARTAPTDCPDPAPGISHTLGILQVYTATFLKQIHRSTSNKLIILSKFPYDKMMNYISVGQIFESISGFKEALRNWEIFNHLSAVGDLVTL
jgi:hypothetical protein